MQNASGGGAQHTASVGRFAVTGVVSGLGVSVVVALVLTVRLAAANALEPGARNELALAMLWLAALVNLGFAVPVTAAGLVLRRFVPTWGAAPLLVGGLVACNVGWVLWIRLAMAHQFVSVRPFINVAGIVENLTLALLVVLLWAGLALLLSGAGRVRGALALAVAGLLALGLLGLNQRGERDWNTYDLATIRETVGVAAGPEDRGGPLFVLGIDGMSWNVLVPLWKAGELPHLRALAASGTIGVLDNGIESLSPRIWTTMYTGRRPEDHGIHDFQKLRLPGGAVVGDMLMMRPSLDAFYGLKHLVQRLPDLGLWSLAPTGAGDRREPPFWDVVARAGKRAVIVNPLASSPLAPLPGGVIANLRRSPSEGGASYQPPELAARWGREPLAGHGVKDAATFRAHAERMGEELGFALDLVQEREADLGFFYTHLLDTTAHMNWDFHSRDRFLIPGRDEELHGESWESYVAAHRDDRVFDVYRLVDREVGRAMAALPDATILLVSDHGWTFFGYEHFGSPDGVFIGRGGPFEAGADLAAVSTLDVAPTILAGLGVPLSRELEGAPVVPGREVAYVDRYERSAEVPAADEATVSDEELERLRAIGYVD